MKKCPIIIDPEFKALCPPLSAEERAQLKASIKEHGLLTRLLLWAGEGVTSCYGIGKSHILIDGHSRLGILEELAKEDPKEYEGWEEWDSATIQLQSEFVYLPNREAVKLWILEHQVGRRNLNKQQRIEMVARIVVLRQEQTAAISKANLKQGDKAPDVGKMPTSGKKAVPAAAKEFDVPEKPLQAAVNAAKGKPPKPRTPNPNYNRAGTRGFKGKPRLSLFLRKLTAIGAVSITSPFPSTADYALKECSPKDAKAVIVNLDMAIERLKEYRKQFEGIEGVADSPATISNLLAKEEVADRFYTVEVAHR
jgi:hypothetical protein